MDLDNEFKKIKSEKDIKEECFLKKKDSDYVCVVYSVNEDGTYRVIIEDGLEVKELESATFENLEEKFDLVYNDDGKIIDEKFLKELEEAVGK